MEDDLGSSISDVANIAGRSIVSQLLEIQGCQIKQPRSFDWAKELVCLSDTSYDSKDGIRMLQKTSVDIAKGEYVAVSYRCEDPLSTIKTQKYSIMTEKSGVTHSSKASDEILTRVLNYMHALEVPQLWIDKESINQDDPIEMETAMQSMDLVYRCSNHPLGILTTLIERQDELDCLLALMLGDLVSDRHLGLERDISTKAAGKTLHLLDLILKDPWWTRRWIFQEDYCSFRPKSRSMMNLLIPHRKGLSKSHWNDHSVSMEGELLVEVAELRTQATLFCLACQETNIFNTKKDQQLCQVVLDKVKSYKVLHEYDEDVRGHHEGHPMSIQILSDIAHRDITVPGDTLAILANCCGYNVRLDRHKLELEQQTSLGLAVLALFLLNGEIFWSDPRTSPEDTILEFLQSQTFDRIDPPAANRQLTFMKKTRLVDVRLTEEGIQTKGHLWNVVDRIQTNCFHLPQTNSPDEEETTSENLKLLTTELRTRKYHHLATNISQYLNDIVPSHIAHHRALTQIFDDTATLIGSAITAGCPLLVAKHTTARSAWGIFIDDDNHQPGSKSQRSQISSIFTAHEPAKYNSLVNMYRSPDKFVSLSVDVHHDGKSSTRTSPLLSVKGWINGLTFPGSLSERNVTFQWPAVLQEEF